jgi:hypothetical protein
MNISAMTTLNFEITLRRYDLVFIDGSLKERNRNEILPIPKVTLKPYRETTAESFFDIRQRISHIARPACDSPAVNPVPAL